MTSKGYALARAALIRTLTAYSGITTGDGEADGTTLVDSNLEDNPYISADAIPEKAILIMSGDARGEDKGAESFDGTDTITLQGTGFSAQIKAGTIYRILNISSIEIDVARIEAKLDTADTDLDTLLTRLSAAKSSYLNELAAAHMPADLDTLKGRLSEYRAGLLNYLTELGAAHIPADIDTLLSRLTAARATNLNYLTELAAAHIPADIDTLLSRVTAAVALEDTLTAIKGAGWTDENLTTIDALIDAIKADIEAALDLTGGASETSLMDGTEKELYKEEAGTVIRLFAGLNIDWTGLHAGGGENTTIKAYRLYGANWRKFYEETFLATAVPDPPVTPVPRYIDTQCTPSQVYYKQGIKITAQQAAEGVGWNTLTFDKVTAAPEA